MREPGSIRLVRADAGRYNGQVWVVDWAAVMTSPQQEMQDGHGRWGDG
jgi:hypothetical protein